MQDKERLKALGSTGGIITKMRYGIEFYKRIGHKGGMEVKSKYGPQYYSRIRGKHVTDS